MASYHILLFCLTACSPTVSSQATPQDQAAAAPRELQVIAKWSASARDSFEVRWVHNSQVIRDETLSRAADTLVVPSAGPSAWDTVVIAVWPLADQAAPWRRMFVFPPSAEEGVRTKEVSFGSPASPVMSSGTGGLELNDDPILADVDFTGGGYTCGGDPCTFPWRRAQGIQDEALEMGWRRGAFDYTPIWVGFPGTKRLRVSAVFKLSAPLGNVNSNVKVWRISNPNRATIYSPPSGTWGHYWDGWAPGVPNAFIGICEGRCPSWVPRNLVFAENIADDNWHTFVWELDVSGPMKVARFWIDGRPIRMSGRWAADGYEDPTIIWRNGALSVASSRNPPEPDNLGLLEEFSGCCSNEGRMLIDRVVVQSIAP